jgi:hypothetical protein
LILLPSLQKTTLSQQIDAKNRHIFELAEGRLRANGLIDFKESGGYRLTLVY